ncbi:unnamed protein product, partial [Mesorhabditis belari]|uniref:Uncharacterized protein n=1 Tax=Mesorhabditis belari TaxID=2138241 RepID=A0AAF3EUH3_9BILA
MDPQWYYEQRYHREVSPTAAGASDRQSNKKKSKSVKTPDQGKNQKSTKSSGKEPEKKSSKRLIRAAQSSREPLERSSRESEDAKTEKIAPDNAPSTTHTTGEAGLKLAAAIYFLQWQQTALQAYTRSINDLYVKPLIEHVTGNKLKSVFIVYTFTLNGTLDFSGKEREELKAGPQEEELTEHQRLKLRLQEATNRNWDDDGLHSNAGEQKATLVEMAVLYRMRTLVQMCGSLLEIEAKLNKWLMKNIQSLVAHSASLNLLPYASYAFEATSTLSEVFQLSIVDRDKCKPEFAHFLRKTEKVDDYPSNQQIKIDKENVRGYIRKVEAQCNCFRACVYVIGSCFVATIHSLLRVIPPERIDIRPREVEDVLNRLPSPFRDPPALRLSAYSADLLYDAPPSIWQYPQLPQGKPMNPDHRADWDAYSEASVNEEDEDLERNVEPKVLESPRSTKKEEKSHRKETVVREVDESAKQKHTQTDRNKPKKGKP